MILTGLTISSERDEVVDFSFPFFEEKLGMITLTQPQHQFYLFGPLGAYVWLVYIVAAVYVAMLIKYLEGLMPNRRHDIRVDHGVLAKTLLFAWGAMWHVGESLLQKAGILQVTLSEFLRWSATSRYSCQKKDVVVRCSSVWFSKNLVARRRDRQSSWRRYKWSKMLKTVVAPPRITTDWHHSAMNRCESVVIRSRLLQFDERYIASLRQSPLSVAVRSSLLRRSRRMPNDQTRSATIKNDRRRSSASMQFVLSRVDSWLSVVYPLLIYPTRSDPYCTSREFYLVRR